MSFFPIFAPGSKVSVSFTDSDNLVAAQTAYTFGISFGPTGNRHLVIGFHGRDATQTGVSVTFNPGNIAATFVSRQQNSGGTTEMWIASVPENTSGSVTISWTGAQARTLIGVVAMYNADPAVHDTISSTANPLTDTINVPAEGAAIAFAATATAATFSWAGLDENADFQDADGIVFSVASKAFDAAQTGLTVTATQSASSVPTLTGASFGPG